MVVGVYSVVFRLVVGYLWFSLRDVGCGFGWVLRMVVVGFCLVGCIAACVLFGLIALVCARLLFCYAGCCCLVYGVLVLICFYRLRFLAYLVVCGFLG